MKKNIKWKYLWSAVALFLPLPAIIILPIILQINDLAIIFLFGYYLSWMWPIILIFLVLFIASFFTQLDKDSREGQRKIGGKVLLGLSAAGVLFLIFDYWSNVSWMSPYWWWNWVLFLPLIVVLAILGFIELFSKNDQ